MELSRRTFLKLSTTAAAAGTALAGQVGDGQTAPVLVAQAGSPTPVGFNPADPALTFDLVITGGDVLDPSQNLHGTRDIGIKHGQIAAIAPSIPADRAGQRIEAAGKLVTPGLVDLHAHYYHGMGLGLPADELVSITGTTTAVCAGDAGWHAFSGFRRWVVPHISSDIHAVSINTPGYPTLPWVMSKFLNLGFPLEDVVAKATIEPARVIGRVPGLGTLQVGAPADVTVFEMADGPVEFVDTMKNTRQGTKRLTPVLTVRAGRPFGRPPLPIPFVF